MSSILKYKYSLDKELNLFKALAEETRYLIIRELMKSERCACEIPTLICRTQSNTSMHLSKLLEFGMLRSRRDGKRIFYSIKDERIKKIIEVIE